jgi:16S rRNA (cytosine1402-N4)-methyltransferase
MARLNPDAYHVPVMAAECLAFLNVQGARVVVDATLGGGGHTRLLMQHMPPGSLLIAFDADEYAIERAQPLVEEAKQRDVMLQLVHANFETIGQQPSAIGQQPPASGQQPAVNGQQLSAVLFDLGVSSFQFDHHPRGFSYRQDAPLDMRFTPDGPTAADLINTLPESELTQIFRDYAQEPGARKLAAALARRRSLAPFHTTVDLRETIMQHTPPQHQAKTLARVFQALRIAVNHELERLATALKEVLPLMADDGRVVVMSYHSLEDRVVKDVFRAHAMRDGPLPRVELLTRKPVMASAAEVDANPRSRSARLRAARILGSHD